MFNIDRNTTNASEPNNNHWCSEPNALMLIFHHNILTSMNMKVQIPIYLCCSAPARNQAQSCKNWIILLFSQVVQGPT